MQLTVTQVTMRAITLGPDEQTEVTAQGDNGEYSPELRFYCRASDAPKVGAKLTVSVEVA